MRKWSHFEDENGNKAQTASIDGYSIAERLLEGININITVEPDGTLSAEVSDSDADYFSQFNEKKFYDQAIDMAEEEDMFQGKDGDSTSDWILIDDQGKQNWDNGQPQPQGITIPMATIPGALNGRMPTKPNPNGNTPQNLPGLPPGKSMEDLMKDIMNGKDPFAGSNQGMPPNSVPPTPVRDLYLVKHTPTGKFYDQSDFHTGDIMSELGAIISKEEAEVVVNEVTSVNDIDEKKDYDTTPGDWEIVEAPMTYQEKMESSGVAVPYDPIMDEVLEAEAPNQYGTSISISAEEDVSSITYTEPKIDTEVTDSRKNGLDDFLGSITEDEEVQIKETNKEDLNSKIGDILGVEIPDEDTKFEDDITEDNVEDVVSNIKNDRFEEKELITINDLVGMNIVMPCCYPGAPETDVMFKTITADGVSELSPTAIKEINEGLDMSAYSHIINPAKSRGADGGISHETHGEIQEIFPDFKLPATVDFEYSFGVE